MKRKFKSMMCCGGMGLMIVMGGTNTWGDEASHVPAGYTGKPYTGKALAIPGKIEAEAYDIAPGGAKDVTFGYQGKVTTTAFRTSPDSIGIAGYDKSHVSITGAAEDTKQVYVGWTETGEWLKYTVKVTEAGTYVVGGKFAAAGTGSTLSMTFTPELTTGLMEIPTTAGHVPGVEVYHVWETLDHLGEITLPAGMYVMTVKIEKDAGMNLDYFTFTKKG